MKQERPVKERNEVVGLEDEAATLMGYLLEESTELEVISIIGMPGLGKTILAQKLFNDPDTRQEFPRRIWVYVSREFRRKEIFLEILKEFTILTDDIKSKTDKALADLVAACLENEKFLLVMDDVWTCEDWDNLKVALPHSNKMGKVLITSRNQQVGYHANPHKGPHPMRFLRPDEGYYLLLQALRGQKLPPELNAEGLLGIASQSGGHPLAIVLIGGILLKAFSGDRLTMMTMFPMLGIFSDIRLDQEDPQVRLNKIIGVSYQILPYPLRECLLYFGMFPEDFEISVWKLIRLWIAEGLIPQKVEASYEETAQYYFEELVDRRLVRAVKFKLDGKVKTCRIHDLIRDFCLKEAEREGFSQQIMMSGDASFQPSASEELKFRRVCIHSHVLNFVSGKPYGQKVRSFVCSSRDEMTIPMKDLSAIPKGFKLLRVLDVEPISFVQKLPRDMFQLLLLRYLVLSVDLDVLPSAFSQLFNIQTLVFNTSSRTLEVRADIFSLTQLRHFKTKALAALPKVSTSTPTAGENIQTLGTISPESCTDDVFDRVRNLKKLGVRGRLALLVDGENESFLEKLENLEKLKLLNDVYPIPPSGFNLPRLPPSSKFPPNLKMLTLSRTCLDWCHMSVIGSLERLKVLKLTDKAFVGDMWEVANGGFRHLEVLHIGRTNLKIWLASEDNFPKLEHLQLKYCDDLQQIPVELAHIESFLKLDLFYCKQAAVSAKEIKDAKIEQHYNFHFMLSVFPRHDG